MITQADIDQVYRQDQRHPYYSIQGGKQTIRINRQEYRRQWTWGHFAMALKRALNDFQTMRNS